MNLMCVATQFFLFRKGADYLLGELLRQASLKLRLIDGAVQAPIITTSPLCVASRRQTR